MYGAYRLLTSQAASRIVAEPRRGLRILSIRKDIVGNEVTRWSFVIWPQG